MRRSGLTRAWKAAGGAGVCLLLSAGTASALQQPNGTTIPVIDNSVRTCSDKNIQVCLNAEERGPTIDALTKAAVTPETYDPNCNLTFKVLARGAGFRNTFGWYNVVPDPNNASQTLKPPDSDLHAFLLCTDAPGASKVLNLKGDPGYTGGRIGFFMASPEGVGGNCPTFNAGGGPVAGTVGRIYYSERKFNPDNTGANSWIHLLTYQSVTFKDSFYFAWEDLLSGGDNDFDDLLTRVEGIQCSGGGTPCQTGQPGICDEGSEQCKGGVLQCVPIFKPAPEKCNALDDDCNGEVDEGDLCPPRFVCDKGTCVTKCGTGEFQCPPNLVCDSKGLCVDPLCLTMTCNPGEVCVKGVCEKACEGVVCPYAQVCRNGRCLDPCDTIVCDTGYACDRGVCTTCSCRGCPAGQVCENEKCIEAACQNKSCPGGHCENGQCVDDCNGAVCPRGQICDQGECVPDPNAPEGGAGSGGADGGFAFDGGFGAIGGTARDGSAAGSAGDQTPFGQHAVYEPESGCACRATTTSSSAGLALFAALGALLARRRRRNSSSRRSDS